MFESTTPSVLSPLFNWLSTISTLSYHLPLIYNLPLAWPSVGALYKPIRLPFSSVISLNFSVLVVLTEQSSLTLSPSELVYVHAQLAPVFVDT